LIINGVDTDSLGNQFQSAIPGRVLILDGDGPCYAVAATVKRMDTAIRHFQTRVLELMFLSGAEYCHVHLTASDSYKNGRFNIVAERPYQGNRTNKAKPPLLEPLRQAVANNETWLPEYHVRMHKELEADDGMIQDAYALGERSVIWSEDKDLRMTPYPYFDIKSGKVLSSQPFGWLTPQITGSGTVKLIGQGPLFFWAQMLMGDTADHIKGVRKFNGKPCGPAGAYDALKDAKDIHQAANIVIDAYRAENQNPIAEGYLLWLLRTYDDHVIKYFNEMNLSFENRSYIVDCFNREWRRDSSPSSTGTTDSAIRE
jgi:hypothetical protein